MNSKPLHNVGEYAEDLRSQDQLVVGITGSNECKLNARRLRV